MKKYENNTNRKKSLSIFIFLCINQSIDFDVSLNVLNLKPKLFGGYLSCGKSLTNI